MEDAPKFETEKKFFQQCDEDIRNILTIAYWNVNTSTTGKSNYSIDLWDVVRGCFDNQLLFQHDIDLIFYRAWSTQANGNGARYHRQQYSSCYEWFVIHGFHDNDSRSFIHSHFWFSDIIQLWPLTLCNRNISFRKILIVQYWSDWN